MKADRHIKIGAILHGAGGTLGYWRHPEDSASSNVDFDTYRKWVGWAETGKLDFIFITDGIYIDENATPQYINQLEPVALLSALASITQHIGLVATISTTYSEPYTIARQLAALDIISGGRAAWNIVTTPTAATALNYGKLESDHPEHDERYRIADEYLDVAKGLWDSWEEGAFIRDKLSGEFFDRRKLHTLNHVGEFFSVKGPLNVERSPQGYPLIFQAGTSAIGAAFAAKNADATFFFPRSVERAHAFYADVKRRAAECGRNPDEVYIFVAINIIIGETAEAAERRYREVASLVDMDVALKQMRLLFGGHDFSGYALDEPFPDLADVGNQAFRGNSSNIKDTARKNKWTLRQTAQWLATPRGDFVGTPTQTADRMQAWFDSNAADGFILLDAAPNSLRDFVDRVIPILQERGVFKSEYRARTFRESLGLPIPANQFVGASSVAEKAGEASGEFSKEDSDARAN